MSSAVLARSSEDKGAKRRIPTRFVQNEGPAKTEYTPPASQATREIDAMVCRFILLRHYPIK